MKKILIPSVSFSLFVKGTSLFPHVAEELKQIRENLIDYEEILGLAEIKGLSLRDIEWSCEHVSSAFIFAITSSDEICLVSSEHSVRKYRWRAATTSLELRG